MKENVHVGHRQRLRELVNKKGLENMPEHQVLEMLLAFVIPQKDTNPLAHMLIRKFGSLGGVLDANKEELEKVVGIGPKTSSFLSTIVPIWSCYKISKFNKKAKIFNTVQAYDFIKPFLDDKKQEEIYVVCIDNKNSVVSTERLSQGNKSSSPLDIKKLTEKVLSSQCNNFILAHNHPDGLPYPSAEDDKLTKAIAISMEINKLNFLDHIITAAESNFYSYRLNGNLDEMKSLAQRLLGDSALAQKVCEFNEK